MDDNVLMNHESRIASLESRETTSEARLKNVEVKVDDLSAIKACLEQLTRNDTERKGDIKDIKKEMTIIKADIVDLKSDKDIIKNKMNYRYAFWTSTVVAIIGVIGTVLAIILK